MPIEIRGGPVWYHDQNVVYTFEVCNIMIIRYTRLIGLISCGTLDPEVARGIIRATADRGGTAPLDSPISAYTFDGEREGIVSAANAVYCTQNPDEPACQ